MKKLLKRWDILFVLLLFFLTIPAEYNEIFSLPEDQTIFFRHGIRSIYRNKEQSNFSNDKIVLMTIDDGFFSKYSKFPLLRSDLASIIQNLNLLEAKVIAVDMMLDLPGSCGGDDELAASVQNSHAILASRALFDSNDQFTDLIYPIPLLKNSSSTGYLNIVSPSSVSTFLSRIRVWREITEKKNEYPIAVKIVSEYLKVTPAIRKGKLILGDISIPLDQFNDIYIDFSSIPNGYKFLYQSVGISASEFLSLSDLDEFEIKELKAWVKDKIVIIGETTAISHDWFDTPVGMIYGAEIIADTVNTLLNGVPLRPAPLWIEIAVSFLLLASVVLCINMSRTPSVQMIAGIVLLLGFICFGTILYAWYGVVISMTYNLIAGIAAFFILSLSSYFQERKMTMLEKKAKEQAERELKIAEAATRMKSEFLANMSHEIRTPMNSILGFLELALEASEISEFQKINLKTAHNSAKSLLTLINDILDLSKLERGKLELDERPFDLMKLMQEMMQVFEIKCREKGLDLSLNISPDLRRYFMGDSVRLRQIIINLVGNAVKFTEQGDITVNIVLEENHALHFSISDTGIGIPAEKLKTIFDPFTQADVSTSRRFGGTGLGTTISKQLAELMNGKIWAESEEGKGSVFHFTVRLESTENSELLPPVSEPPLTSRRCFKVLIAEDVEENITLARIRLEQQGHTVIEARNGRQALEAFDRENPDIILMDVHMPEMDGVEASKKIREQQASVHSEVTIQDAALYPIPIIALTASMMKEEQELFLKTGMNAVVGKPINFTELFMTMEKLVPEGRGQRTDDIRQRTENEERSAYDGHRTEENMPLTDGVDTIKGILIWQNAEAYRKALLGFSRDYPTAADNILNMLKKGDNEGAYRLVHTLKGIAGNLSVTEVFRIASELNAQVKEKPIDELLPLIESLAVSINMAVTSIRQFEPEKENQETQKEALDNSELTVLFTELTASFDEYNPDDVLPFLEKLSHVLSEHQVEPIRQMVDRFDFEAAKEETVKLAKTLCPDISDSNGFCGGW